MKNIIYRYKYFIILSIIDLIILLLMPEIGQKSFAISWESLLGMLSVLPPVFILLGLLDVWVERETMMKYMGEESGLVGIAIAFLLGSAAAGPLYAAFPVAGVLIKKGCKFTNILIFIGAWSTTKIPMLLFEGSAMGWEFMLTRFIINIPGIALIAYITERFINDKDRQFIHDKAMSL